MSEVAVPSQVLTCCFTDIEQSTQLLHAVGDTTYHELIAEHFEVLRGAFEARSGRIVKSTGDGLFAVFEDPEDALAACLAAQRDLSRHPTLQAANVRVRMGLHTGEVLPIDGGDYQGLAVHQSARVSDAAHGGQVLISGRTAELVPSELIAPVGTFSLKGISTPIVMHQLIHPELPSSFPPPRARPAGARRIPPQLTPSEFVGRTRELAKLRAAWSAVKGGSCRTVLIGGQPGVGKTELAAQMAELVFSEGGNVLYGGCQEAERSPYGPFRDALSSWVMTTGDDEIGVVMDRWGHHLVRLFPELRVRFPAIVPAHSDDELIDRYWQSRAVIGLLAAATALTPALLVLDDVQWIDASSLRLLDEMMSQVASLPLLLVANHRDVPVAPGGIDQVSLDSLIRHPHVTRLTLAGLPAKDVDALVQLLGQKAEDLTRSHGGNPFFVRQMLAMRSGETEPGSLSASDLAVRRTSVLSASTQSILRIAAVVGREFTLDIIGRVDGSSLEVVLDAVREASIAEIIEETQLRQYRFRHDLLREGLYESMDVDARSRVHRLVAEVMETGPQWDDHVEQLVFHFERAGGVEEAKRSADYALLAARRAWSRLALESAIEMVDRGISVLNQAEVSDPRRMGALLTERGTTRLWLAEGNYQLGREDLLAVVALARSADLVDLAASAIVSLSQFALTGDSDPELSELQVSTLEQLEACAHYDELRILLLGARGRYLAIAEDRGVEGRALTSRALEEARTLGDRDTLATALFHHLTTTMGQPLAERPIMTLELESLAKAEGDSGNQKRAAYHKAVLAAEVADPFALDGAVAQCKETRFFAFEAMALHGMDSAESLIELGLAQDRGAGRPVGEATAQFVTLRWWQDRIADAEEMTATLLRARPLQHHAHAANALFLAELGRHRDAARKIERLAPGGVLAPLDGPYGNSALVLLVEAICVLGDASLADQLQARIEPLAGRLVTSRYCFVHGSADRYMAMLNALCGRERQAELEFERALLVEKRIGALPLLAHTQYWYADFLAHSTVADHQGKAESMLVWSRDSAAQSGIQLIRRKADALLSKIRGASESTLSAPSLET